MGNVPVEVGGYRVERELGRGGMGAVYLATDPRLGRKVAVKVLLHELSDPERRRRFQVEAEAVGRLSHPGIVGVHEVGTLGRNPYLVLELVEGETLEDRLQRAGPLPPDEAAALVAEVADAVEHAHQRGILHRDLKPANVLIDAQGRPRLTDFGLARELSETRERLTQTGELLGTPSYMAPEQAGGDRAIGPAVDVYGLGAVLYRLLTGVPPFSGASLINLLQQILLKPPAAPSALRPDVPKALDRIVSKALEKDPARRHRSAAELAGDLRAFLAGEGEVGSGVKALAGLVVALTITALVLTGVLLTRAPDPESVASPTAPAPSARSTSAALPTPESTPSPTSSTTPSPSRTPAPAAWPVGAVAVVASQPVRIGVQPGANRAFPELPSRVPFKRFGHLRARLDAGGCPRAGFVRGGELVLIAPGKGGPRTATLVRSSDWAPVDSWKTTEAFHPFDAQGALLARLVPDHVVEVLRVTPEGIEEKLHRSQHAPFAPYTVALDPRGRRVAVGFEKGFVELLAVGGGRVRDLLRVGNTVRALRFSPDGGLLYVGARDERSLKVYDAARGRLLGSYPPAIETRRLAVSPDGREVIAVTKEGRAYRYRPTPRGLEPLDKPLSLFPTRTGLHKVAHLLFTPDGAGLLASSREAWQLVSCAWRGRVWKTERTKLSFLPTRIALSRDGRHLLVAGSHPGVKGKTLVEVWSTE